MSVFALMHGPVGLGQHLGLPFSEFIGSSDYNSGMLNSAITQDKRGFMYFANNFGLLEFDGSQWRTYPVRDGSKVRDVAIAPDSKIYVAAQGDFGYFLPNDIGNLTYLSLAGTLPEEHRNFDDVWKVFIGKNEIYFCTSNKVFIYYNDVLADVLAIESSTNFYHLNKRLYLQNEGGGLYSLINGKIEELINKDLLTNKRVISILPVKDNKSILITSNNGFYDQSANKFNTPMNLADELRNATINCALRLKNGYLALGTQDDGLFIYNDLGILILHLTKGSGLNYRVVLSMFEDKQGNLWLGHNNGVSIVELSMPFSYINEDLGLPGSGYDAYSSGDELFLVTNNGLFQGKISGPGNKFQYISNTAGQAYYINELNGNILLGHHNGSFEISSNSAVELNNGTGTWTYLNSPTNAKIMIAGTYKGLELYNYIGSSWKFVSEINGFSESSRVMEFDEYGDIWMTHGYKGVFRLTLNNAQDSVVNVQYFGVNDGLPSQALINVFKIENELIFTTVNGPYIFDYRDNRFKPEPVLSEYEVLNKPLNFLANDAKSNIYFLGQEQIGILVKQSNGSFEPNIDIFNKVKSLLNDDLQDLSIINSSNILFGAKEGFIVYNPFANFPADNKYNTYLRSVIISSASDSLIFAGSFREGNKIVSEQPETLAPVMPYNNNSLQFVYSANFMNNSDQTMYQHMLEGFEDHWSPWHKQSENGYTNLKEGDYTLRVKAKNTYNIESIEAVYRFTILAPWYRTNFAYAGYSLSFFAVLLIGFAYIDRKYRHSKKHFELTKQLEVDEIGNKLESLTQETSEEIDKLKSEKLQSEVDFKNAELASSTMNLIYKNQFISHIKSDLTNIAKRSSSDELINELNKINKEIDKNISHDDDWDQFTFHFNSVHGDFTTRLTAEFINLSGQDLRMCSYLRLNLSTKEIAQLLNISIRGVEISRYRLRKKLMLERADNLSEFILNY